MDEYYVKLLVLLVCFICNTSGQEEKERVGNPDDYGKIERPCPTFDLNCIRVFFQKHARCSKAFGPAPDPLVRPELNVDISKLNLTVTLIEPTINGINGRVGEFYINITNVTNNLVISVEFENFSIASNKLFFTFYRRAKEPVVTTSFGSGSYRSLVMTAVIPDIDDLKLEKAECTTFADSPASVFTIGPGSGASSDPQVQLTVVPLVTDPRNTLQEQFLSDSFYYLTTFIQYNICDFGLLLT